MRRLSDWLKLVAFVGEGDDRDSEGPSTFTLSLHCSVLTAPHQTYRLNSCLDQVICTWYGVGTGKNKTKKETKKKNKKKNKVSTCDTAKKYSEFSQLIEKM